MLTISVIGTGAIGGYYGAKLARGGQDVHFLLHRDYEYVKEHGLYVKSCDGDFRLDKRSPKVAATIYTKEVKNQLSLDLAKHNVQYQPINVKQYDKVLDRYLCIDNTVYHIGASLKDLGKRWFSFNKMEMTAKELLGNVK